MGVVCRALGTGAASMRILTDLMLRREWQVTLTLFPIRDSVVTLVVAEQGSLRRAAAVVNLSRSTIMRRVSARIFARRAAHPLSKGGAECAG